jgi:hypothetical protein
VQKIIVERKKLIDLYSEESDAKNENKNKIELENENTELNYIIRIIKYLENKKASEKIQNVIL